MSDFKVGDRVQWTRIRKTTNSIDMEMQTGAITVINGNIATVKPDYGKRKLELRLNELQPINFKSALYGFVQAAFARNREPKP